MSADNMLVLIPAKGGKYEVHDVGFSGLSSHPDWGVDGLAANNRLCEYVAKGSYNSSPPLDTPEAALENAEQYARRNIVEYGIVTLIPGTSIERRLVRTL